MKPIPYYIFFSLAWLISLIPFWFLYRISDFLYFVIYHIVGYRKKTVFKNLRTSFPEKSDQEITGIAKSFYRHFSDFLVEIVKQMSLPKRNLDKRVTYINPEVFLQLENEKRNFALVSAHYNNWEMLNALPCIMKHILTVIYRPLKNRVADGLSFYMRSRYGAVMVPMENIFREAVKNKSEGRLFCIWFLADQRPPRLSRFWTMFLNHETAFFEGVEKISRKMDLAVVFMDLQKIRRGHYEASFEILFENASSAAENEVMLTCVRRMEQEIIKKPEFWLWSHKRFKHPRPADAKLIMA